jgi:UDP-glucose 4-epimerase
VTLFGDGGQTRDFISVHDVARANVLAATAPGLVSGTANICTGRGTSLREVLAVFQRYYPSAPAPVFAPPRGGDIRHSRGDPAAAAAALGFRATVPVEDGLAELAAAE